MRFGRACNTQREMRREYDILFRKSGGQMSLCTIESEAVACDVKEKEVR
jgi:hypothetical protein